MKLTLDNADMDAQLQRSATASCSGSADLGEAIATARRVAPDDHDGWHTEWSAVAEKTRNRADQCARDGFVMSAARGYLRATEYWRQAIFFIRHDLDDARLLAGYRAHRAAFRAALPLLPWHATPGEIPLAGGRMGIYLLRPSGDNTRRPTILAPAGFDSTAEAGYAAIASMALARDYNVMLWDGPGQGGMLYEQRIAMRPDFEAVLAPVIDWTLKQKGIDPEQLVLVGRSFAGYLAPRAAATESRLAALVCDPGQVEFVSRLVPSRFSPDEWKQILAAEPMVDQALERMLEDPRKREFFGARMATFGARTVAEFLRMQVGYTVLDRASQIRCPTLVTEGEGDFASQGRKLFDLLTCEKRFHQFTEAEGAGGHCCGLGATLWEEVVFDWLDQVLAARKKA